MSTGGNTPFIQNVINVPPGNLLLDWMLSDNNFMHMKAIEEGGGNDIQYDNSPNGDVSATDVNDCVFFCADSNGEDPSIDY